MTWEHHADGSFKMVSIYDGMIGLDILDVLVYLYYSEREDINLPRTSSTTVILLKIFLKEIMKGGLQKIKGRARGLAQKTGSIPRCHLFIHGISFE